jgi:molybdenum cofactor cytidylyltransferase
MLCDQPLIETTYLNRMINSFHEGNGKIIATAYGRHNGVPALFSLSFFPELLSLENDFGARELLKKHEGDIYSLSAGNNLPDIDTRQDYENLLGK